MQSFLEFLAHGLFHFSIWQIVLFTLAATHITIAGTTLYLHRSQTHRGVDFHPAVAHFFRFWLWLTSGMKTREWVAVHRKHHAKCEREGDPHSPAVYGVMRVFLRGADLYRVEASMASTLERYGRGTPDDWLERNVYTPHSTWGILIMLVIDLLAFGALGLTVWAVQMAWIPFWAAGVVNGLGHFVGYRNFSSPDASTNLSPLGLVIGGEELHNNHHAHATSAKFSSKWYEFDLGWMYIRILQALGLAKVRRVAPKRVLRDRTQAGLAADLRTLEAVQTHRYDVMRRFGALLKQTALRELRERRKVDARATLKWRRSVLRKFLLRQEALLSEPQRSQLDSALSGMEQLQRLVDMRQALARLWESSSASSDQLLQQLRAWLAQASGSGITGLSRFARDLSRYA
ncbi:fatty acid desaturase [Achromobacter sp. NFACC18-2]|uniref:DesA family fatty acid desaturase n=1 Tax=Achromobacter sp. NFACC18-2 TaxID=1564112 RepID=UPI0008CC0BE9|nr:fatty acid desaturase [Achromobacter sp. NFACC18-2]SEK10518.1 stearoyl-CoA desaturase (delta-9 desaturase) [Achromobacter sp. NFACC18-2]